MSRQRGGVLTARVAFGLRAVWIAVLALLAASVVAVPAWLIPASASTLAVSPASVPATLGQVLAVSETWTATGFAPTEFSVAPALTHGITFDAVTLEFGGTPTHLGNYSFAITGTDGIDTATDTVTVHVSCPTNIEIDTTTASMCLVDQAPVTISDQGSLPGDTVTAISPASGDPHIAYNTQVGGCPACHRMHSGDTTAAFISQNPISHSVECFACHDGTGANTNIHQAYSDTATGGAVNNATTRSYYTHDALAVNTNHLAAGTDEDGNAVPANEFQGVSNRHSDCVDCHNPHSTSLAPIATQIFETGTSTGWALSGALKNSSVVLAGTDTATAFVGRADTSSNREYQLCLKCHSSFTVLGASISDSPTLDWLDKAAEVDTDTSVNKSFHPIAGPGTNQTETMTASLNGPSTWKIWRFANTDTVRCTNCHSSGVPAVGGGSLTGGAGQALAPHASANRGILILPYRDRNLVPASESTFGVFEEFRVALCFACHTDVPFKSETATSTATDFRYHFQHVAVETGTASASVNMDINVAGAGNGHALCSECHFRLHSTKNAVTPKSIGNPGGQDITGSRLVNFAPNVQPVLVGGVPVLKWTPRSGATPGTCTLKCHGAVHRATAY